MRILICGVSTRAAAESAARAGFTVTAIDAFADLDQHPSVRAISLPRDLGVGATPAAAARAATTIPADAVVYLSSFENHPRAVATLAAGRALWGNPPEVLRRVRDPLVLAETLSARGLAVPAVVVPAGHKGPPYDGAEHAHVGRAFTARQNVGRAFMARREWLIKPLHSGGGQRVRRWTGGQVPRRAYLQEYIEGTPGSIVFAAAARRAVPIGVSRQLVGDAAFGARGYRYCGSIMASPDDPQLAGGAALVDVAIALASVVAEEFDLAGVNGIDFIARDGVPYPIEVNPRWSASMELVESLAGLSVFGAHADACVHGTLPRVDGRATLVHGRAVGKAIVFARRDLVVGDTRRWLGDPSIRDVPRPGERFKTGQPVCTVFAAGIDGQRCYDALVERARRVYAELEDALTARGRLKDSVRA